MPLTTQPKPVTFARVIGYTSSPILHGQEVAGATWKAGCFLQDDDAGYLTPSTSPIDASAVADRTFLLARDNATGVTGADVEGYWLGPETVLEGTLSDATAGTHTIAQTDMWKVYPITQGSTNWYLDANAVSDTGGGIVVGFKDAIGTVDGRVYFIITNTVRGGADTGSGTY